MEQLILENQNLIYAMTKYFEGYKNKEDLIQAGCVGMIMAYKNFNKDMNVKFTTYAYPYILGEMRKLIREDKSVKVGRNIQKLNLKIEKANIILSQKLMRIPSIDEVADFLEIPVILVAEALNSQRSIMSIDEPIITDGKEITLHDTIGEKKNNINDLIMLKEELQKLKGFERDLIINRYIKELTQQETADYLGISQVQVSRKEQKILSKLKSKIAA